MAEAETLAEVRAVALEEPEDDALAERDTLALAVALAEPERGGDVVGDAVPDGEAPRDGEADREADRETVAKEEILTEALAERLREPASEALAESEREAVALDDWPTTRGAAVNSSSRAINESDACAEEVAGSQRRWPGGRRMRRGDARAAAAIKLFGVLTRP